MHIMGKVGVWLVVIAAAASTVLTAKFIQVRNSWTKKASTLQKQYQDLQPKIAEQTELVARLEADLFRARDMWGLYWNNVQTAVENPATGTLVINIGANHRVNVKDYLYGFEILQDGKTVYRGDFTVVAAQDVQSRVQANFAVRPEDVQTWQQGNWRWRNMVPPGNQPVFDVQDKAILRSEDVLADRREKLKVETGLETDAKNQLDLRNQELVGGDKLSKDADAATEFRDGYVAAVEEAEEERNQLLRKVDELRRRLRAVQQDVDKRQAENVDLARKLPQPATAVGAK